MFLKILKKNKPLYMYITPLMNNEYKKNIKNISSFKGNLFS